MRRVRPRSIEVARTTTPSWVQTGSPLLTFIVLGLPAGAIGVAWPYTRASLGAPLAGLGLVLAVLTLAYFLASASSGPLTARLGTPALLIGGCACSSIGLLGVALATQWWMIPVAGFAAGAGSGLIDASVNAHVSLNRGIRYMGWLHASWAVGAALGPQVVLASLNLTHSWRAAFGAMSAAYLATGAIAGARWRDWAPAVGQSTAATHGTGAAPAAYRRMMLILAALFLVAAGLEATAGDWSYTQLTIGRSLTAFGAGWAVSMFWAGLAAGRIVLGTLGDRATPTRILDVSVGLAVVAATAFWLGPPQIAAFVALPILGIAVSVLFPLLLSITPARVGSAMTAHAVGYQLAAGTVGGGGLPAITGVVLQAIGVLALGPLLLLMAVAMALLHTATRLVARRVS